jgi:hypothetical protein
MKKGRQHEKKVKFKTDKIKHFIVVLLVNVTWNRFQGDEIEDERGGKCSSMGEMRSTHKILVEKPKRKKRFGGVSVHERIILIHIGILKRRVDWINLAHDAVKWRDLMNTVMNFRVP